MARLVSSWSNGVQTIPKDYVMPPEIRPGDFVSVCKEIPVIDLQENTKIDRSDIIQQILKASQEFGLFQVNFLLSSKPIPLLENCVSPADFSDIFQKIRRRFSDESQKVINHGVSEKMMEDIRVLYDEFFNMSVDDKLGLYSETYGTGCTLYTSGENYVNEKVHYWKDTLKHPCHPLEAHTPSWPEKPVGYREEVGKYAVEVRKIGFKILDLIAEGLGLNEGYFNKMSQDQTMVINHYPPCPDPSLSMGIGGHTDPNLISVLQQDQYGLQMHKDGKWMGVDPITNAFVVNIGYQLEIISNGKLKSVEHRAITSSTTARTSIGTFFGPNRGLPVVVEPAKELVTSTSPQMFKSYQYNNFVDNYLAFFRKPLPRSGTPLDPYRL